MQHFDCLRVRVPHGLAERVVAEAWAAGIAGLEEREVGPDATLLLLYAPAARAAAVQAAVRETAGPDARIGAPEPVPERDWAEAWKQGLEALVVSPRLLVRPPFLAHRLAPGQQEVVIEPGRAFGTGAHASTALALELVDAACAHTNPPSRVLDVGTGSGVLALAALRLGAARALGCDLDPAAVAEARANARANGLAERLLLLTGSLDALAPRRFELLLANLLRSELLPLLPALAACTAPGGRIVLSGLLVAERAPVAEALEGHALRIVAERTREDARGDHWLALTASS